MRNLKTPRRVANPFSLREKVARSADEGSSARRQSWRPPKGVRLEAGLSPGYGGAHPHPAGFAGHLLPEGEGERATKDA